MLCIVCCFLDERLHLEARDLVPEAAEGLPGDLAAAGLRW